MKIDRNADAAVVCGLAGFALACLYLAWCVLDPLGVGR